MSKSNSVLLAACCLAGLLCMPAEVMAQRAAVEADTQKVEPPPNKPTKWMEMDYGPFLTTSIVRRDKTQPRKAPEMVAYKGIAIRLKGGDGKTAGGVVFDTDLMTMSAGWTGGYLDLLGSMMGHHKGTANVAIVGEEIFSAAHLPGVAMTRDPRPEGVGPLPADAARFRGLYVNGDQVVLSYELRGVPVHEVPGIEQAGRLVAISRTFTVGPTDAPLSMQVAGVGWTSDKFPSRSDYDDGQTVIQTLPDLKHNLGFSLIGNVRDIQWRANHKGVSLTLPSSPTERTFKLLIMRDVNSLEIKEVREKSLSSIDPKAMTYGDALRWPEVLTTRGKLGRGEGAYVVDDLGVPEENPWTSWMRTTGVDFFSDGRAAVCTFNGDVWVVSGINQKLEEVKWKRYAAGLYEPLGIRVVDDVVYVRGRDQITRLHDLNKDGEADFYENFNSDDPVNPSYHGFCFELQTDAAGNFWYTRTGHRAAEGFPGHGVVHRISKDGKKHEVMATGLRAPNGLGISPEGVVAVSDNQGNWVPSSKVNFMSAGDFLGYMPQHHRAEQPSDYALPAAWIPMTFDSSSGSPIFVSSGKWGPLAGKWVHTSFGRASLLALLTEEVAGVTQGAVVKLPLTFDTGIMRGRFHPVDGQLYLTGVGGGWQAGAPKDGGLYRVRYTGKPLLVPVGVTTEKEGIRLTFAEKLDRKSAGDDQNYAVEQWNYVWSEAYGSPDFSVTNAKKKGRDEVAVSGAAVAEDGKSVLLKIPDLGPVMQLGITMSIETEKGEAVECEVVKTIHRVIE